MCGTTLAGWQGSFISWDVHGFSGFCLGISSNKKLTPSQSSHSPRAEKLEKVFWSWTLDPCGIPSEAAPGLHLLRLNAVIGITVGRLSTTLTRRAVALVHSSSVGHPQLRIVSRCSPAWGKERALWPLLPICSLSCTRQTHTE